MSLSQETSLIAYLVSARHSQNDTCTYIMQHSGMQVAIPGTIMDLMKDPTYSKLKDLFVKCRADFKANPQASVDLEAYQRRDNLHDYTTLIGLVPQSLVGKSLIEGKAPFERSESIFTDFDRHYPENCILSTTEESLIIGNQECHDVRLYSANCDPKLQDKPANAGMAYMHLMVIPKQKLYNIVSLEGTQIIEEMISHFKKFWGTPGSIQRSIDRVQLATYSREQEIIKGFKENPETEAERMERFKNIIHDVRQSDEEFATKSRSLSAEDFFFGFHPAPNASVGHLHMHVLPTPCDFRHYSTGAHDWKTIPAAVVREVIREEEDGRPQMKTAFPVESMSADQTS